MWGCNAPARQRNEAAINAPARPRNEAAQQEGRLGKKREATVPAGLAKNGSRGEQATHYKNMQAG